MGRGLFVVVLCASLWSLVAIGQDRPPAVSVGNLSPAPPSAAALPPRLVARVKNDSLPVYAEMSKESDVVLTLTRGTVVHITFSVSTDQGLMCNVSNVDTSAKLGFVACDGLETGAVTT
jgi:hypothetical protein